MKSHRGYTLLEMLIVLVIISITFSMAMLSVGHHQHKQLKTFTQTLLEKLTLAEELAILKPTTLGLIFTSQNFGFYEYQPHEKFFPWKPLLDPELGIHPLPAGITVRLKTENQHSPPTQDKPAVIITANGSFSPFRLLISDKHMAASFEMTGYPDGTVTSRPT